MPWEPGLKPYRDHEIDCFIRITVKISFSSMVILQVPKVWSDKGFVSMKPLGSWLKDLIARLDFLNTWVVQGPPKCYWMSGFFFPQAR